MNMTFTKIRIFFERNGFNVSTRLAERLGLRVKYVRLFYLYKFYLWRGLWPIFCFCLCPKDQRPYSQKA